ncbi:amidase [Saccharothrix mutabilis subsp. mutabilis]|uniref:Amidase n=1 Tax=Saccharothrix mutabilis subsp. mutabilis TaxID=66855 RepID=A0ABP3E2Y3_9PSEU
MSWGSTARRAGVAALVAVLLVPSAPAGAARLELDSATIPHLVRELDAGRLTSVDLTRAYLRRIDTVDRAVRSVLAVDPTALRQAAESDRRRRDGRARGPLDGIPLLLKDNIDTRGLATTAGSRALRVPPRDDAELVTRLRAAGAVVLGKTNLSEWSNFRSTRSISGWSAVGGQTHNPHVLDRSPCGSSSGSGAAVAASLAQVAVGTETDGSIVCPAGVNGIVGLKPTLGVVSADGIVPISSRQDTAGPMARHVVDAAVLMSVLDRRRAPYELTPGALRGARVGVWRWAGHSPEVGRVVASAVEVLRRAGATVVDVELAHQEEIRAAEWPALLSEFRHDVERYLATRPGAPRTLAELIAFNERDPVELSRFGQEVFLLARDAPPITDPGYVERRRTATALAKRSIDEVMTAHDLDVIVSPTNTPAPRTDRAARVTRARSSAPAAVSGYPNATVPAGFVGDLPVGLSFLGGHGEDVRVLRLAAAFEQAAAARRPPRYLPG